MANRAMTQTRGSWVGQWNLLGPSLPVTASTEGKWKEKKKKVTLPRDVRLKCFIRREVAGRVFLKYMWIRRVLKDLTSDQCGIWRGRCKWMWLSVKHVGIHKCFVVPTSQCISIGPNELSKE